ncbi:glucosyltransferase domain-containing protein [Xenorhabdus sp. XENO-7]|uniref:Glucosyltransferase domain-containing protein n=1 Tax=Xenorhabdus aichiensis TaxID=3025874 RepID=A0ABT5M0I4_9GAMM|nr:glucosyltransferase domain-containing protein [Xenorhabdus aichiensis]MDC9621062.1 glucosyltransferase domain-containing protein [Xenorhabdus aichiensis]
MNSFISNCKNSSIILCLYMVPIFLFGTYYRDDNGRVVSQYFDWDLDGRPLTNLIIKLLNFDGRLTDIAPMSQILAIIISAISCGVICTYIVKSNKIAVVISSSLLFLSPFYIQNLLYHFDVVTMALSILFATLPFIINERAKLYVHCIVSMLSVMCLLTTYQASLPVFYALILLSYLCNSSSGITNIARVISGGLSLFIYYFIVSPFYVGGGYAKYRAESISISSDSIISSIKLNFSNLYDTLTILINHEFAIIFSVIIILLVIKLIRFIFLSKIKKTNVLFFLFFSLSFISSFIIFFLLKKPVYEPRIMIGVNALIMLICILVTTESNNKYINLLASISIIPPVLLFFSISTNYINASKAYVEYEKDVIRSMYYDYRNLNIDSPVYVYGYLQPPYITDQILQKIPFLKGIVGSRIGSLTNYMSKIFPLFEFKGYYDDIPSSINCIDIVKNYNGTYSIIKFNDGILYHLGKIECN